MTTKIRKEKMWKNAQFETNVPGSRKLSHGPRRLSPLGGLSIAATDDDDSKRGRREGTAV